VPRAGTLAPDAVAEASLPGRIAEIELKGNPTQFWSLTEPHGLTDYLVRAASCFVTFELLATVAALNVLWSVGSFWMRTSRLTRVQDDGDGSISTFVRG
jgi:hypothetical protein